MHPVITEMIVKARQDDLDRAYRHPRDERSGGRRRVGRRRAERRY